MACYCARSSLRVSPKRSKRSARMSSPGFARTLKTPTPSSLMAGFFRRPNCAYALLWQSFHKYVIYDFRNYPERPLVESDVCIIGAGAAGLTVALEFLKAKAKICVLESGGLELETTTQRLCEAENVGVRRKPHTETRLRVFGGTTNHWTGLCAPLSEHDFQSHSWLPYSGWPVTKRELELYYERALEICQDDHKVFDSRLWETVGKIPPPISRERLQDYFIHYTTAVRFGSAFRQAIQAANNTLVLLHANATSIQSNPVASHIEEVQFRTLEGKTGRARAKIYVLCCGGIENARLMLLSNRVEHHGLGNRRGIVGRFFMDHPFVKGGEIIQGGQVPIHDFYCDFQFGQRRFRPGLSLNPKLQAKEQVLNCGIHLWQNKDTDSRGTRAASRILGHLTRGRSADLAHDLEQVISDLDRVFFDLHRRLAGDKKLQFERPRLDIFCVLEQAPDPSSRITLSDQLDGLGLRQAKVDWRVSEQERRTAGVAVRTLASELGRLNLGRVYLEDWLSEESRDWRDHLEDYNHHFGTTRMSDDPRMGVVNRDCRVHGIDNLYIAGSSVFPTTSYINPTLTIVALAVRLADQLKRLLS